MTTPFPNALTEQYCGAPDVRECAFEKRGWGAACMACGLHVSPIRGIDGRLIEPQDAYADDLLAFMDAQANPAFALFPDDIAQVQGLIFELRTSLNDSLDHWVHALWHENADEAAKDHEQIDTTIEKIKKLIDVTMPLTIAAEDE